MAALRPGGVLMMVVMLLLLLLLLLVMVMVVGAVLLPLLRVLTLLTAKGCAGELRSASSSAGDCLAFKD